MFQTRHRLLSSMHRRLSIISVIYPILAFSLLLSGNLKAQEKSKKVEERINYINTYKELAVSQMQKYGIPASITLAQGCIESGNGKSTLAVEANNHFGIKCHDDWKGKTITHDDDEAGECFRKYDNVADSYIDHSEFLRTRPRYASLFDLDRTNYKEWALGLKVAGYATNPNYANELIKVIEDYELYKYDSGDYDFNLNISDMSKERVGYAEEDMSIEGIAEGVEPMQISPLYAYSMERQIYSDNGRAYIFAKEGDTYKKIGKEYNISKRKIVKYNRGKKRGKLRSGDVVYLEKTHMSIEDIE